MATELVYKPPYHHPQRTAEILYNSGTMFLKGSCLLGLVAVAACQLVTVDKGPTVPWENQDASSCVSPGDKIVDNNNMCWYHECVRTSETTFKLLPRACPVGTRVRYTFIKSTVTPCKHNHLARAPRGFECSREADSAPNPRPFCATRTSCKNGGTLMVEDDFCWCKCPPEWSGDSDCSKGVNQDLLDNPSKPSDKCVDGSDGIDHCAAAGGCLNGGTCVNQCGGFHCFCPSPFKYGKRCERFTCNKNSECLNGGICSRGVNDRDEARICLCPPGVTGYRCENDRRQAISDLLNQLFGSSDE